MKSRSDDVFIKFNDQQLDYLPRFFFPTIFRNHEFVLEFYLIVFISLIA